VVKREDLGENEARMKIRDDVGHRDSDGNRGLKRIETLTKAALEI
jgi:hypothetical protein